MKKLDNLMMKKPSVPHYREAGFRQQRLFVLPPTIKEIASLHPLLKNLLVTDAGVFPKARDHFIHRPNGAATTLLIACLAGKGMVRIGGTSHIVTPGTLVWLPADQPHYYGAKSQDPWTIEWVHFCGTEVKEWQKVLQIPDEGGMLSFSPETVAKFNVGDVWIYLEHGYSIVNQISSATALRRVLVRILKQIGMRDGMRSAMERIDASILWMKERLVQPVNLKELSEFSGLSVVHYSMLFRKKTGFAPIDWFNRMRVQRACELLSTSDKSIAEVATEVGYTDPFYFTRYFKQVMGVSPRTYRNVPKG